LKYEKSTTSSCKDIEIRKLDFVESGENKEVWLWMRRKERKTIRNNYIREKIGS